jgi:hypothetical protein
MPWRTHHPESSGQHEEDKAMKIAIGCTLFVASESQRNRDGFGARMHLEFFQGGGDVVLDGFRGDAQPVGKFGIGMSAHPQGQSLADDPQVRRRAPTVDIILLALDFPIDMSNKRCRSLHNLAASR